MQIDAVGFGALQGFLNDFPDVLRSPVKKKAALFIVEAKFGCDNDSVTDGRERLSDKLFVCVGTVKFGCIEERDAFLMRCTNHLAAGKSRLRAIATFETKCHRTAKAVAWLRSNYEKPLRVEHLATIAGMSRSTLHLHFRALTAMSPLQFQKQLRLHATRQRMLTGELDAASAAFEVGYESPSQFNREYRRFFGRPPIRDIKALRNSKVVAIATA